MKSQNDSSHVPNQNIPLEDSAFDAAETVDRWDTVVIEDIANSRGIVLETQTATAPLYRKMVRVGDELTVGRTSECDLVISPDKKMSRQHFVIQCKAGYAVVRDLNSTNGVFVNGLSVSEAEVYDGDQIIAGTTSFVVRLALE